MPEQDWASASAPGGTPTINSIFDFSAEALGQLKVWIEQSGLVLPPTTIIGAGSQTYTPTWTASIANPTVGNGVYEFKRYSRNGRTINATVLLTMGTTTTYGNGAYYMTLPIAAASGSSGSIIGTFEVYDSSANSLWTGVTQVDSNESRVTFLYTGAAGAFQVGAVAPFTFAQSDQIKLSVVYEASS